MTAPLQVTAEGLRTLGQRCTALGATVAPALPGVPAAGWQASATATGEVNAGANSAAGSMRGRLMVDADKLDRAAGGYTAMDEGNARELAAVGAAIPAGAGADGGAGALGGPAFTPLTPRSGGDGGAGGFGVRR